MVWNEIMPAYFPIVYELDSNKNHKHNNIQHNNNIQMIVSEYTVVKD